MLSAHTTTIHDNNTTSSYRLQKKTVLDVEK